MLPVGLALHRATSLRSLRCADRLAGATLRRVRRAEAGVRQRPRGGGVRRAGAAPRCGVEGARSAPPCRWLPPRWSRKRVARPGGSCVTFVPADPDRRLRRGHHAAERLAAELVRRLGATARAAPPPGQRLVASARVVAGRPPSQRRRRIPGRRESAAPGSSSSTTCTRPARRQPQPHLHCARTVRARSRS